jgi:hypothetical protein
MTCSNDYAFANQEQIFVIEEAVCGTLQKLTTANRIYTVGPVDFSQERELIEDSQIRASASQLPAIKARLMVGEFSFETYVKPSGSLGTAPETDVLFKALMGKKTIDPGVKVDYELTDQLISLTIWLKKGHSVFALRGATIESAEFTIAGDSVASIKWSGKFMERLWAGECAANDTCGVGKTEIAMVATGGLRFTKGMYVQVGTDDNTDAGYELTDVNYTTNKITISPSLVTNQGTNPTIYPFWPVSTAEVGEPVHGKLGLVTVGGKSGVITTSTITLTNNLKYYDNEKNGVWTAENFGRPGKRGVEGSMTVYFLKEGLSYFYRADYKMNDALILPVGNVAGKIMEISIPYAQYKAPKITGTEEFMQELSFSGVASASLNDELKITFK